MCDTDLTLTAEQIDQYHRDGVLFLPGVFGEDELDRFRRAAEDLRRLVSPLAPDKPRLQLEPEQDRGHDALRMIEPLVDLSPPFKALTRYRRILRPLEQIIGEPALLFEDKLNYKPARIGSGFKLHQDSSYWLKFSRSIISVFVHLDDATIENGCLQVIPGFHCGGVAAWADEGCDHTVVDEQMLRAEPIKAVAKAGDVVLIHCLTPHASEPNRSDGDRRALVLSYNPASDGDQYRYGDELLHSYHGKGDTGKISGW